MNPFTGEISFEFANLNYSLRPSFGALAEIEQALDKSVIWLLEKTEQRGLIFKEQEIIFYYGLKYGGHNITKEEVKELLQQLGIIKTTELSLKFLYSIFD